MTNNFEVPEIPNEADQLHCLQAAFRMSVATLTGDQISMSMAESITGFSEGAETWPYRMIEWLGSNGFEVIHIDALDAAAFAADPIRTLRESGLDSETIEYFQSISDFDGEAASIKRSLNMAEVRFIASIPEVDTIADRMSDGWLPLLILDAAVLAGRTRAAFEGHAVLISSASGEEFVVEDPGPPPRWNWTVSAERLKSALRSPADTSGTITFIRPVREGR